MFSNGLWVILLEVLVALGLGVFIVWWTLPRRRPPEDGHKPKDAV